MALNIKDDSVHEAVKRITRITGESQAQAVATAVRERAGQVGEGRTCRPAPGYRPQDRKPHERRRQGARSWRLALRRPGAAIVIVDASAVIAILTAEDDAAIYAHAIADASARRLSAASYLECGIVLDHQRDPIISRSLDELLRKRSS